MTEHVRGHFPGDIAAFHVCRLRIFFQEPCYIIIRHLLSPAVHCGKEQCIIAVHRIYPEPFQIALVMLYGLLHDGDCPCLAPLSPDVYIWRFLIGYDVCRMQPEYLAVPCPGVIEQYHKEQVPVPCLLFRVCLIQDGV